MRKPLKRVAICLTLALLAGFLGLLRDKNLLRESVIRLHVVANSDSQEDQAVKLQVRDAVLSFIEEDLQAITNVEEAKAYLQENLPKIQLAANTALKAAGVDEQAVVSLCQEVFDGRNYETFRLPSGVYEALRIVIGDGLGHNWWCVSFPSLCMPTTVEAFSQEARDCGMSDTLVTTLKAEESYELRFFLLDVLGKIENSLFAGE